MDEANTTDDDMRIKAREDAALAIEPLASAWGNMWPEFSSHEKVLNLSIAISLRRIADYLDATSTTKASS
jgi:hypothetical protein